MGLLKEFRDFALKGNVLDLAVGVIIGTEFGKIVNSMIADIIMPLIGRVAKIDFGLYKFVLIDEISAFDEATKAIKITQPEVAVRFGAFITVIINFVILAFCIFLVVKAFNTARKRFEKAQIPPPPPPPAGPTTDQVLLTEIRDLLAKR
jgi:large conductance mechanosensitive channel